jgi:simple sugar transport system permease protein
MIVGAFSGILIINIIGNAINEQLILLLALLVSGFFGLLFSFLLAYSAISFNANQIITGTALNLFASAFVIFIARMLYGVQQITFTNSFHIGTVPGLGKIPFFGPLLFQNTYLTTYLGLLIFFFSWILLYCTKFGLRLRACGEHPQAADSVGINVYRIRYIGVLLSGFLAGIGGLIFVIPTSTSYNASVSGYGFLALAVLIFGQWRPDKIFLAALFFGMAKMIASAYSGIPVLSTLPVSNNVYKMIPYIATLIALAFASKNSRAPKASGQPYNVGRR